MLSAVPTKGSAVEAVSQVPGSLAEMEKEFASPSNWFRIQFLLRTNDEMREHEIEWQVHSMAEQGAGGTFSYCEHLQGGSPEKLLTDWWWKVVDRTAAASAKEGILYWAYDEEDWPSGTAGGRLLEQYPDLTWKYIHPVEHQLKGPVAADIPVGSEPLIGVVAFQVDGKTVKADSLTDVSERVSDERLRWDVPAGDWTVAVYTAGTGKVWNAANYPDLMSRAAGAAFVDLVYRAHDERVARIPGASITGFFTDEPSMTVANYPAGKLFPWVPAMPYSPDLPEAFRRTHGHDWRSSLPLLYHETPPLSLRFRCNHWETCNRLYADNYFGQMYKFCEERGQLSSGHIHIEESLMAHLTLQGGNILNLYRSMHIPGIDWIHPWENPLPANTPKFATSVAHFAGKPRTWCETFAASGLGLTFQQMRRMLNWGHVNGINMVIPICYKYSLRGAQRAQFYGPGISYQQPYWDHFRAFADYDARLCLLTSGQGHVAQIALAYPAPDLWSHCWDHELLAKRSEVYFRMGDALRDLGYDYDVLDDQAICEARVDGSSLATATERFVILILPNVDTVSRPTIEKAIALAGAGGTVLAQGGLPRSSKEFGSDDPQVARLVRKLFGESCYEQVKDAKPFWHNAGKGRAAFAPRVEDLPAMLHAAAMPDLMMNPGSEGLCALHRRLPDGDLYLVLNRREAWRTVRFTLSTPGHPERWNLMTGEPERLEPYEVGLNGTSLTLTLAPDEIVPIVIRRQPRDLPNQRTEVVSETAVPGPFRFRVEQTMARPHVAWNFTQVQDGWHIAATQPVFTPTSQPASVPGVLPLGDWCALGLGGFSGIGHYETDVSIPAVPEGARVVLGLGKVAVSTQVFVNGSPAGIAVFEPYQLDITKHVKSGANRLHIAVANTLANYYGQFAETAKAPLSAAGVRPEHKLSGLLGPITVRIIR